MKSCVKTFALASIALISLFSCSSLSAQTDALIVDESGHVGVGTASPGIMPQVKGLKEKIHFPVFETGNMLLFGQPDLPILVQMLLPSQDDNRRDADDYAIWREVFAEALTGDPSSDGLVDGDDFGLWNEHGDARTYEPSGASHHDNWRENN